MSNGDRSRGPAVTRLFRSRYARAAAALLASLAVGYGALRPWLYRKASCDQPCRDLGADKVEGTRPDDPSYRPRCAPLKLTLEVAPGAPRVGHVYGLFYRLRLKNTCCEQLTAEASGFLFATEWDYRRDLAVYFRLWPPGDGKDVHSGLRARSYSEYSPIVPYVVDEKALPELTRLAGKYHDPRGISYLIDLQPGQEIVSTPSKLEPFCPTGGGDAAAGPWGGVATVEGRAAKKLVDDMDQERCDAAFRKAGKPVAPPPPSGFRAWDEYKFDRPGVYRIQAVYEHGVSASPVYPNLARCPYLVSWFLEFFDQFAPGRILPAPFYERRYYEVEVASNMVEFEVRP